MKKNYLKTPLFKIFRVGLIFFDFSPISPKVMVAENNGFQI